MKSRLTYYNALNYLKKRAIRLYPIYLFAVLISFFIHFPAYFSAGQFLGHLAFAQVFLVNTVASNVVLWSLAYEVIYYLLFLGLWISGKYNRYVCLFFTLTIGIYAACMPDLTALISLLTGWIFWMAGFWLSQQPKTIPAGGKRSYKPFISYFALVLAIHNLDIREYVVRLLRHQPDAAFKIGVGDLVLLPVCALIVLEVTDTRLRFINYLKTFCYLVPACYIAILLYYHHSVMTNTYWESGTLFFLIAIVTVPLKMNAALFEKLNYMGGISYALYVFHFPVAVFLNIYLPSYFSGVPLYVTGVISWAVLTTGLAILTEKIIQPSIKAWLAPVRRKIAVIKTG